MKARKCVKLGLFVIGLTVAATSAMADGLRLGRVTNLGGIGGVAGIGNNNGNLVGGVTNLRLLGDRRVLGSGVGGLNVGRRGVLGTGILRNPSQHR